VGEDYVERCIAITAEQLHGIPDVIAVAGGAGGVQRLHWDVFDRAFAAGDGFDIADAAHVPRWRRGCLGCPMCW
jgi:hypothetical protein